MMVSSERRYYSDNVLTFPYFCAFLLKEYLKGGELNIP